MNRTMQTPW